MATFTSHQLAQSQRNAAQQQATVIHTLAIATIYKKQRVMTVGSSDSFKFLNLIVEIIFNSLVKLICHQLRPSAQQASSHYATLISYYRTAKTALVSSFIPECLWLVDLEQ